MLRLQQPWGVSSTPQRVQRGIVVGLEDVFRGDMDDELHTLARPVVGGETTSAEQGGNSAAWIDAIPGTVRDDLAHVRAVVCFDVDEERDGRTRSATGAWDAFVRLAADERLAARTP